MIQWVKSVWFILPEYFVVKGLLLRKGTKSSHYLTIFLHFCAENCGIFCVISLPTVFGQNVPRILNPPGSQEAFFGGVLSDNFLRMNDTHHFWSGKTGCCKLWIQIAKFSPFYFGPCCLHSKTFSLKKIVVTQRKPGVPALPNHCIVTSKDG